MNGISPLIFVEDYPACGRRSLIRIAHSRRFFLSAAARGSTCVRILEFEAACAPRGNPSCAIVIETASNKRKECVQAHVQVQMLYRRLLFECNASYS
jgi:hypothetical protein